MNYGILIITVVLYMSLGVRARNLHSLRDNIIKGILIDLEYIMNKKEARVKLDKYVTTSLVNTDPKERVANKTGADVYSNFYLTMKFQLLEYTSCGNKHVQNKRIVHYIVGGHAALEGAWPWQTSLQYLDPNTGERRHVCGGTLISSTWVLTAAHCVDGSLNPGRDDPNKYEMLIGSNNIHSPSAEAQSIQVKEIIPHPDWAFNPTAGFPNDIALMELSSDAVPGSTVGFACIPPQDLDLEDKSCWITGWGSTTSGSSPTMPSELQEAESPVVPEASCQQQVPLPVGDKQLCVGGGGQPTTCSGDSGGPMSCLVNGLWFVTGVDSWGLGDCNQYPSVLTKVSKYKQWIDSVI